MHTISFIDIASEIVTRVSSKIVTLEVDPCTAPRMSQRDKWLNPRRPIVQRYFNFKDKIKHLWPDELEFPKETVIVQFRVAMPKSWSESKKKHMFNTKHESKPDIDNYIKGLLDAMLVEDKMVSGIFAEKRWDFSGSITILAFNKIKD